MPERLYINLPKPKAIMANGVAEVPSVTEIMIGTDDYHQCSISIRCTLYNISKEKMQGQE